MGARARARKAAAASQHAAESLRVASRHAGGIITIGPLVVTQQREAGLVGVADDLVHLGCRLPDLSATAVDAAEQLTRGATAAEEVTDAMDSRAVRDHLTLALDAADQVRRTIDALQREVRGHQATVAGHPADGEPWPMHALCHIQVALSVAGASARAGQAAARSELAKSRPRRSFERLTVSRVPISLTYMVLMLASAISLFWVPPGTVQVISMSLVVLYGGTNGLVSVLTDRARLHVTARVGRDTFGAVSIEHLDAVLDAIAENCHAPTWVDVAVDAADLESPRIGIGLGANHSTLRFLETCSSPTRVPIGTSPVPCSGGFGDGDSDVAMEPDTAIPVPDARAAVREFVKSACLPASVHWQPMPLSVAGAPQHRRLRRAR